MAYSDFTLSEMTHRFLLSIDEKSDLFSSVPEIALRPEFMSVLEELVPLALSVSTEKARSELIIAPILLELWRITGQSIGFFSGIEFSVDKEEGLTGICDFILTRSSRQLYVEAPVFMLTEAKNEDMKRGYAQCIAEMIAAQRFNAREGYGKDKVYGAVTIGERWKFLELEGAVARIDSEDYYLEHIHKIMGILLHLTTSNR